MYYDRLGRTGVIYYTEQIKTFLIIQSNIVLDCVGYHDLLDSKKHYACFL
jgi:hypothetical protein